MKKLKIALFHHQPECSIECCNGMIRALSPQYEIKLFTINDDINEVLDGVAIVAFPGGIGDSERYFDFFRRTTANEIAAFLSRGGKYLGICMGAYWAGPRYFDILDRIDCVQYIKRETSEIRRSYGTIAQVKWNRHKSDQSTELMFFYDGCTFVGDGEYELVATYLNNNPMAIIQGNIGIIGCHPESEEFWYETPYQYINKYWHDGKHHSLLLDFVNKLMDR
jgi:glutamine amidotransferase-like uncharacterized protein